MQDQAINDIYFEHTVHQNLNLLSKETNTRLQNAKKKNISENNVPKYGSLSRNSSRRVLNIQSRNIQCNSAT